MDTTYILGAGFSFHAGIPLMEGMTKKIFSDRYMLGSSNFLSQFCSFAYPNLDLNIDEDGCVIAGDNFKVNIEDFLTSLDAFRAFDRNTKYNPNIFFSADYLRSLVMNLIGQYICDLNDEIKVPDYFLEFVSRLHPGDRVITLNWDSLLEKALNKAGVYWRYPNIKVSNGDLNYDHDTNAITLIKLHGSADWRNADSTSQYDSILFSRDEKPVVVSSRAELKKEILTNSAGIIETCEVPYIIPPSHFKDFPWKGMSGALWLTAYNTIVHSKSLTIVGYSMPQTDYQVKWLLRTGIMFNHITGKEFVKKFWGCKTEEDLSFALQGTTVDYNLQELQAQVLLNGSQGLKLQWDESIIPVTVVNPDLSAELQYKQYVATNLNFINQKAEDYFIASS